MGERGRFVLAKLGVHIEGAFAGQVLAYYVNYCMSHDMEAVIDCQFIKSISIETRKYFLESLENKKYPIEWLHVTQELRENLK